ncbi:MAG: lipopolysaccharide transport periplasmic protein LptA [Deltaproteobacteria bacterium]|nr:lipopolysaccharide transport periplasmic protein LptA [Deltaproteobacteria bacterium]
MRLLVGAGLAALLALAPVPAGAAATPAAGDPAARLDGLLGGFSLGGGRGPVRIDADTMEFDYKTMVLTYRGKVKVSQADMTLQSDTLTVTLTREGQKPKEVIAAGGVVMSKGTRTARGGKAVFDDAARTVTLSEQAVLQDGPNEVAGERVVVYLDEQRSVVEGGPERVRAVLVPPEDKRAADGGDGR